MGRVAGVTADEVRQRVLDSAAVVFAENGFENTRIADIAREAGLSTGAMYNHYHSKAELLAAVIQCHAGNQLGRLLTEGGAGGVLELIQARGVRLDRGPVRAPLLVEAAIAARRDPEVLRVLAEQVHSREVLLAELVRLAQASGEVMADTDPDAVARLCLMLLLGSLMVQVMELGPVDEAAWSALIERLVDGFRAPVDQ